MKRSVSNETDPGDATKFFVEGELNEVHRDVRPGAQRLCGETFQTVTLLIDLGAKITPDVLSLLGRRGTDVDTVVRVTRASRNFIRLRPRPPSSN